MPQLRSQTEQATGNDHVISVNGRDIRLSQVGALVMCFARSDLPALGEFLVDGAVIRYYRWCRDRAPLVMLDGFPIPLAAVNYLRALLARNEQGLYPNGRILEPLTTMEKTLCGVEIRVRPGTKPSRKCHPGHAGAARPEEFLNLLGVLSLVGGVAKVLETECHRFKLQSTRVSFRPISLQTKPFGTIIIDPPWPYEQVSHGTSSGYSSEKYQPLPLDELAELPVSGLADCVFLWATSPFVASGEAQELLREWGYEPTSMLYWIKADRLMDKESTLRFKPSYGVGYWFRGCVEPILVAKVKGSSSYRTSWIGLLSPNARHSKKPSGLHELVESSFPPGWVELFGREERVGWTVLGNEVPSDGNDIRVSLPKLLLNHHAKEN